MLPNQARYIFSKAGEYGPRAMEYVLSEISRGARFLGLDGQPLDERLERIARAASLDAARDALPATIAEAMSRYGLTPSDIVWPKKSITLGSRLELRCHILIPAGLAGELASSARAHGLFEAIIVLAGLDWASVNLTQAYAELGEVPAEIEAEFAKFWGRWALAAADYLDRDKIAGFLED